MRGTANSAAASVSSRRLSSEQADASADAPAALTATAPATGFAAAALAGASAVNDLDAVLFLDVDGVLHPPNPKHEKLLFRTSCMELLRDICRETGAKIVLSTTWRLHAQTRTMLAAKLAEHGCPPFVSRTPSIAQFQRPREIMAWVTKHRPKCWVAVDDWPLHEDTRMTGHFVQTRNRYGLQPDTAARVTALFAEQRALSGAAAPWVGP